MLRLRTRSKKGQAAVTDLFVAIGIFIVLITITSVLWNLYHVRLINRMDYDDLVIKNFQITDFLLKTSGSPANWDYLYTQELIDEDDIYYVGLVEGDFRIPYNKTYALTNLTEYNLKEIFHAGQYRFGIRIKNITGDDIYTFGKVSGSSKFSVNLARNIMYQEIPGGDYKPAIIEVILSK